MDPAAVAADQGGADKAAGVRDGHRANRVGIVVQRRHFDPLNPAKGASGGERRQGQDPRLPVPEHQCRTPCERRGRDRGGGHVVAAADNADVTGARAKGGHQQVVTRVLQRRDDQIDRSGRAQPRRRIVDIEPQRRRAQLPRQRLALLRIAACQHQVDVMTRRAKMPSDEPADQAIAAGDDDTGPHSVTAMRYSAGNPWSRDNSGDLASDSMRRPIA